MEFGVTVQHPPTMSRKASQSTRRVSAFTLIELLVVVAIIGILAVIGAPAFLSGQKSTALTRAGNEFVDAVAFARQIAASKSTVTCVVLMSDPPALGQKQAVTVLEYNQMKNEWTPLLPWRHFPESAQIVDLTTAAGVATSNQAASALAPLGLRLNGQNLTPSQFSTVLFYPEGGIESGTAPSRRFSARMVTESSTSESNLLPNYYDIVINADTAAYRVFRP